MPTIKEVTLIEITIISVPHREEHKRVVDKFQNDGKSKILGAPYFPFEGATMFIETEKDQDAVESMVKSDPYVKNKIVDDYSIKEFDMKIKKRFERLSGDFLYRS